MKAGSSKKKTVRRTVLASLRLRTSNQTVKRAGTRKKAQPSPATKPRRISRTAQAAQAAQAAQRREFREWRASLPTALERDTLLWPEVIAESVVQEAELYLEMSLPPDYAERLAAKAHHLYPRHQHFHKALNRPGNRGRDNLYVYMRHWTCSWLKRERYALYKKLPWSFALGVALYPRHRHSLNRARPSSPSAFPAKKMKKVGASDARGISTAS